MVVSSFIFIRRRAGTDGMHWLLLVPTSCYHCHHRKIPSFVVEVCSHPDTVFCPRGEDLPRRNTHHNLRETLYNLREITFLT